MLSLRIVAPKLDRDGNGVQAADIAGLGPAAFSIADTGGG